MAGQQSEKKILHLTLKRKWFDLIASGEKRVEYRAGKKYWSSRLIADGYAIEFDEVHFRNGYRKDSPFMRVEWKDTSRWSGYPHERIDGDHGEVVYCGDFCICLGKVLEVRMEGKSYA